MNNKEEKETKQEEMSDARKQLLFYAMLGQIHTDMMENKESEEDKDE